MQHKKNIEGSFYIVKRGGAPRFQIIVLNTKDRDHYFFDITETFWWEADEFKYIFYDKTKPVPGPKWQATAAWFYEEADWKQAVEFLKRLTQQWRSHTTTQEKTMEDFLTVSKPVAEPATGDSSALEAGAPAPPEATGAPALDNPLARFFAKAPKAKEKPGPTLVQPPEGPEATASQGQGIKGSVSGGDGSAAPATVDLAALLSASTPHVPTGATRPMPTTPLRTPRLSPDAPLLRPSSFMQSASATKSGAQSNGEDSSAIESRLTKDATLSASASPRVPNLLEMLARPPRERVAVDQPVAPPVPGPSRVEQERRDRLREAVASLAQSDEFLALLSKHLEKFGI
eukprot:jgi/Botrbrau1/14693/Bobra.0108s0049.2